MAKQTTFETDNGKYIFQHPGIRFSEQMKDEAKDRNGKFMPHKYYQQIMQNVIVEPAVDYAYFDELEGKKSDTFQPSETEYKLVHPGTKTVAEMDYQFLGENGIPSEVNRKEQLMKHFITVKNEPVSFKFFDELGNIEEYYEVTKVASDFKNNLEFTEVMNAASRFLGGKEVS